jgi:hypothetical protein
VKGRRRPDLEIGKLPDDLQPGDYWKVLVDDGEEIRPMNVSEPSNLTGGVWRVIAPMSYGYAIGHLTKHTVREHEDGTISVLPGDGSSNSILITGHHGEQWHGYIDHGVWSAV